MGSKTPVWRGAQCRQMLFPDGGDERKAKTIPPGVGMSREWFLYAGGIRLTRAANSARML